MLKHLELWLLKFFLFFSGCYVCFWLQSRFGLTPVIASSITGFAGTFLPESRRIDKVHVHATIFVGSFAAMGSMVVKAGPSQILVISLIGSTIYFFARPYFNGLGGRMGLIAFIASLLALGLNTIL